MKIKTIIGIIIFTVAISMIMIIPPLISSTGTGQIEKIVDTKNLFTSEDEYIGYIKSNVSFEDMRLSVTTIQRKDNFWKIARDSSVDIDTLIGANPYWNDLMARMEQEIVVPSESGILAFITEFRQIKALAEFYQVRDEDVIVQKLPLFFRLYYGIFTRPRPIAVFIKNARPSTLTMTEKLARQYTLREMFRSPLGGRFSSFFGSRRHPIFQVQSFHNGVDIAAPRGTWVGASRDGYVQSTGWMGGYGKAIIIVHPDGYKTLYGHLSQILTVPGRKVKAGSIIGKVGSTGLSTGPHLHFTLWHHDRLLNPMKILW